jgi:hypothetical protein
MVIDESYAKPMTKTVFTSSFSITMSPTNKLAEAKKKFTASLKVQQEWWHFETTVKTVITTSLANNTALKVITFSIADLFGNYTAASQLL